MAPDITEDGDDFLLDAKYIRKVKARRQALIRTVKEASGVGDGPDFDVQRAALLDSLWPFISHFQALVSFGDDAMNHIFVRVQTGQYQRGVRPLLAWLWTRDPERARTLYEETGLTAAYGIVSRRATIPFGISNAFPPPENIQARSKSATPATFLISEAVDEIIENLASEFFGREDELREIEEFVAARMSGKAAGLLVITAPAGFGKSSLAAAFCKRSTRLPTRKVVRHFCRTTYPQTTSVTSTLSHLSAQLASVRGDDAGVGDSEHHLAYNLSRDFSDGCQLVVWLDGIDEIAGELPWFLPRKLGKNVCVIVSARADDKDTPPYLKPFFSGASAHSLSPAKINIQKLAKEDVDLIVRHKIVSYGDSKDILDMADYIYHKSENGFPLFVRFLLEDAVRFIGGGGSPSDFCVPSANIDEYVSDALYDVRRSEAWAEISGLFALMSVCREPVTAHFCQTVLQGRGFGISFEGLSPAVARWFSFIGRLGEGKIAISHPRIQEAFRRCLGAESVTMIAMLCEAIAWSPNIDDDEIRKYSLAHFPHHLMERGSLDAAEEVINRSEFANYRDICFGAVEAERLNRIDGQKFVKETFRFDTRNRVLRKAQWLQSHQSILAISVEGRVGLWKPDGLEIQKTFLKSSRRIEGVKWISEISRFVSWGGGYNTFIDLWDFDGNHVSNLAGDGSMPTIIDMIWNGNSEKFICASHDSIIFLGVNGEAWPASGDHYIGWVGGILPINDERGIVAWSTSGMILTMDYSGEIIDRAYLEVGYPPPVKRAEWIPSTQSLLLSGRGLWCWNRQEMLTLQEDEEDIISASWSDDTGTIRICRSDKTVISLDIYGDIRSRFCGEGGEYRYATFSGVSDEVVAVDHMGNMRRYDASGNLLREVSGPFRGNNLDVFPIGDEQFLVTSIFGSRIVHI